MNQNTPKQKKGPSALTRRITTQVSDLLQGDPSPDTLNAAYRLLAKWRTELIRKTILSRQGSVIQNGPFAGLNYQTTATEGSAVARLLGAYEVSLTPVIETIIAGHAPVLIDIGCAEGYYAVGLARRMPKTRILARDSNPEAQAACRALAELNGVADRIEIGGIWTHQDFNICATTPSVVLCDIEGEEADLLDPVRAPGLKHAAILVEVHDCFRPGLSETLKTRFRLTHDVRRLDRSLDPTALPPWMDTLSDLDRLTALWEWRAGPTPWLWMEPKTA